MVRATRRLAAAAVISAAAAAPAISASSAGALPAVQKVREAAGRCGC